MLIEAENYSKVIIGIHNTDSRPQKGFGIVNQEFELLTHFAGNKDVTLVYFGNPLALPFINNYKNFSSIIVSYSNTLPNNLASAQMIFGGIPAVGTLPVKSGELEAGFSCRIDGKIRISYGTPQDLNFSKESLSDPIDSIINSDLKRGLFTGAQLLLLHKGRVIINKAYGDVSVETPIKLNQISYLLTILPNIIKLTESGKISLEGFLGQYLELEEHTQDANVLLSDLLMHRSGLGGDGRKLFTFSDLNIRYLRAVIESSTGEDIYKIAKKEFLNQLGIYPVIIDDNIYATANDLVKFLAMISFGGEYGGKEFLNSESVDLIKVYKHYYTSDEIGNLIWTDPKMDTILVFLNNGKGPLSQGEQTETGTKVRRVISGVL
jgi:hypothetical protein